MHPEEELGMQRWTPHNVARLARYLLAMYALLVAYLLFWPTTPGPSGPAYFDLVGHVALFFVLGLLVGLSAFPMTPAWRMRLVLLVGLVIGLATEGVQGLIATRDAAWSDLSGNWFGTMMAGLVVGWDVRLERP